MRSAIVILCLASGVAARPPGDAEKVPPQLMPCEPVKIGSAEALRKAFPDEDRRKAYADVDFEKFEILIFEWRGSGLDRFTAEVVQDKDGSRVEFSYRMGATDDSRPHRKVVFAPKNAKWVPAPTKGRNPALDGESK